jgi:CHAT domain-containing protein/tetratricopeptide (TPR) repeat protein
LQRGGREESSRIVRSALLAPWLALVPLALSIAAGDPPGVVVETVEKGSAGERAGIHPGDVLLSWERTPSPPANPQAARGTFLDALDFEEMKTEEAPRGRVVVWGRRGGEALTFHVGQAWWGVTAAPRLAAAAAEPYQAGQWRLSAGDLEGGLDLWRQAAADLARQGESDLAGWLSIRIASEATARSGAWDTARAVLEETLRAVTPAGDLRLTSELEFALGRLLESAERYSQAVEPIQRSLAARRKLMPGSLVEAAQLSDLAFLVNTLGDSRRAEALLTESLHIRQRAAPGSWLVVSTLDNLGIVQKNRGDLSAAETTFRRSLALNETALPDGLDVAQTLAYLGDVADLRADGAAAEDYERRALAIRQRLAPDSLEVAASLHDLGSTLLEGGDAEAAEESFRRSLSILERHHVSELAIADERAGLGTAAWWRHDYPAAERSLRQALETYRRLVPAGRQFALTLDNLADSLLELGRLEEAESDGRQAAAILAEIAPGSALEASAYRDLAVTVRRRKRPAEARQLYAKALAALESQEERLGGSRQDRTGFAARYADYYHEAIDLLVELGRKGEAFALLERYRAHQLLKLLVERDLTLADGVPADLEAERRRLHAEYDRAWRELGALSAAGTSEPRDELQRRLRDVRFQQDGLQARIRAASPRLSALRYPRPLDLPATRQALDRGTLLLSYSIGKDRGLLFAAGPEEGTFQVFRLAVTKAQLEDDVRRFRTFVEQSRRTADRATVLRFASPLSARLLAPAASQIARATRLLVLADGPLHFLPFAALADPGARRPRFLVEAAPIATAASVTVFSQLKSERRERTAFRVSAFGDPTYPPLAAADAAEPALRGALRSGLRLDPLPGSRAEVESLRAIFPWTSHLYLGPAATEEQVKALGRDSTIVHFACHGILDERSPLDSALALTIPTEPREGQDNGLLQAWEIFEQVRLDADLVTLSACQSALGKEIGGEGLLGLTRAFQYAGARSVLASLWSVGDTATAVLMKRFYGYFKAGRPKDEALRSAQLDLLAGRAAGTDLDASHPFYWAAFELAGDSR